MLSSCVLQAEIEPLVESVCVDVISEEKVKYILDESVLECDMQVSWLETAEELYLTHFPL